MFRSHFAHWWKWVRKHKQVSPSSTQTWTNSSWEEGVLPFRRTTWSYRAGAEGGKGQRSAGTNPRSFSISRLAICPDISWKSELEILHVTVLLPHRLSTIKGICWWKHLRIDTSDVRHKSRSHKQPWYLLCGGERYDREKGWPQRKGRTCGTWHCYADVQYNQQKGTQIPFVVLTSGTLKYLTEVVI